MLNTALIQAIRNKETKERVIAIPDKSNTQDNELNQIQNIREKGKERDSLEIGNERAFTSRRMSFNQLSLE